MLRLGDKHDKSTSNLLQNYASKIWQQKTILLLIAVLACFLGIVNIPSRYQPNFSLPHDLRSAETSSILKPAQYSRFTCGNDEHHRELKTRQCVFKNVCIRLNEPMGLRPIDLFYYRPNGTEDIPVYRRQRDFTDPFVQYGWTAGYASQPAITPKIVYTDRMPSIPQRQAVLARAFWPENFGHALGDDAYPIFRVLQRFAFALNPKLKTDLVMHPSCKDRGSPIRGCKNHDYFLPLAIPDVKPMRMGQGLFAEHTPDDKETGDPVCFETLLLGGGYTGMSVGGEGSWEHFMQVSKERMGFGHLSMPKKHKIVIFEKHGRRKVLNFDALTEKLQALFDFPVMLVNPADLSFVEQMQLMAETTVVVSPPGGIGFTSVFLPSGAAAVYIDYWDTHWNVSVGMEEYIFGQHADIKTFQYPILKESEVSVRCEDKFCAAELAKQKTLEDRRWLEFRDYADTTLDIQRMVGFVKGALYHSSQSFDLGMPGY